MNLNFRCLCNKISKNHSPWSQILLQWTRFVTRTAKILSIDKTTLIINIHSYFQVYVHLDSIWRQERKIFVRKFSFILIINKRLRFGVFRMFSSNQHFFCFLFLSILSWVVWNQQVFINCLLFICYFEYVWW